MMAKWSDRRQQNPVMSICEKHDKAIGSCRANNPLWPCIETSMPYLRPEIREQPNLNVIKRNACKPRMSPHTDVRRALVSDDPVVSVTRFSAGRLLVSVTLSITRGSSMQAMICTVPPQAGQGSDAETIRY